MQTSKWLGDIDHNEPDSLVGFVYRDRIEEEGQNPADFLKQDQSLVDAIEEIRNGTPKGSSDLVTALNDSLSHMPRFKVVDQKIKLIKGGELAVYLSQVIEKIDWEMLKKCRECKRYFYGRGQKKNIVRRRAKEKIAIDISPRGMQFEAPYTDLINGEGK